LSEIKTNELKISSELSLPREAATWVLSYLAKRGAGKTYNAAVQAEEMVKVAIPIGVIDGMGIWWGLRASADGKGAGLPIVVFGGEHADLPLVPEKAAEIAKAIVESNISFVLDLSNFSKYISRKIVIAFLDELYRLNRVDRHIFIEESDMFAPQKPIGPEENLCLSSVDNFVRRGGNHNLGCTLITQRSAVLNKNILTQSDCLVILRTLAPVDKKAIQAWVEQQTDEDEEKLKQWYDSLNNLENGEAWVWHPEKPVIYQKVKFRKRETFHATREFIRNPQATQVKLMNVSEFVSKFKTVFEQKNAPITSPVHPSMDKAELEALRAEVVALRNEVEEFRSGRKLAEGVQQRLKFLGKVKVDLEKKINDQAEELKLYDDLQSVLRRVLDVQKIYDNIDKVREVAEKHPGSSETAAGSIVFTESIPEIHLKVNTPIVNMDEQNVEGKVLKLALQGFFDAKKRMKNIAQEVDRCYATSISGHISRDLTPALEALVAKKILQRREYATRAFEYWLVDGAKDRIKEVP
jgi:hypothetical protein